ncbi:peptidylprolyl isomerase [Alginatibacterium sediminis]|uniref:Periplasmic chaperone PpiD n=1 Tax=Alginatibacterium sediminis TaxID=2164068 RepID=A0A420EI61_9ALTE|nr:SurA N-terminal domain-containing protein [Alginatibacterium sediminis]RKF20389.1 peptidylprolyl isomerase [Alginatibacterium sediminis]
MLEKLREGSQGPLAKIILALIILSFALAGIGSYIAAPTAQIAATVNGEDISQAEFDQAYQNQRSQMEEQYGDRFAQLAATPGYIEELRRNVLDQLIDRRLIDQKVESLGLRVSDDQVRFEIRNMPEFSVDGQFDNDRYLALLYRANMSVDQFRESVRADLTRAQLQIALFSSDFALPIETKLLTDIQQQKRDFDFVRVSAADFTSTAEPSDEQLQSYYNDNLNFFQTDESVDIEYINLALNDVLADIEVNEADIENYYRENQNQFARSAEIKVAHILVAEEDTALALETRLQAGEDFAELAKTESDDSFSGENGGELDWFEPGVMDEQFETAAFALNDAGQISGVVKSEFGYHLIKLIEKRESTVADLETVREQIQLSLAQELALNKFYEVSQRLGEVSFELPDGLADVATELGLEVKTIEGLSRNNAPEHLAHNAVLSVAFDIDVIEEQLNSDLIQVGDDQSVVLRVTAHQRAGAKDFDEVKDLVQQAVISQIAAEKAAELAASLEQSWKAGDDISDLLAENVLSIEFATELERQNDRIEPSLTQAAFTMPKPSDGKPSFSTTELFNGDSVVIQLKNVSTDGEVDELLQRSFAGRLTQIQNEGSYAALLQSLRAKSEIEYTTRGNTES